MVCSLALYIVTYCLRNACMCCTARHTLCFVSFYCYEYWVLLDMLYVCWNTLIFETASLQFSHEYFKIEKMKCYATLWIYVLNRYVRIFGVGSFSIWTMVWGKLPWQSNAKQSKCFWISQFLSCSSVFPISSFTLCLSLCLSDSFARLNFPAFATAFISLLHLNANTTSLTFQSPYVCTRIHKSWYRLSVTSFEK